MREDKRPALSRITIAKFRSNLSINMLSSKEKRRIRRSAEQTEKRTTFTGRGMDLNVHSTPRQIHKRTFGPRSISTQSPLQLDLLELEKHWSHFGGAYKQSSKMLSKKSSTFVVM